MGEKSDMIVRSSGGLAVNNGPSVLGEQQAKIPVGGKIRPGIKVLTATAQKHPKAGEIYKAGFDAMLQWAAIEKKLMEVCKFEKSPLTPKNVSYFSVFPSDFSNPAMAHEILTKYGTKVDGVLRLQRFPIIFATDSWQANMPHGMNCYTRSALQFWSEYTPNGDRRCMMRKPVAKNAKNNRAVRQFGGREAVPRPDNAGVCDPNECQQYQDAACNLTGSLLFFVPGVQGSAAIALPVKSFYAMEQARQVMALVAHLRGGRISGTHDGKPIFWITKKQQEVAMLDRETGQPKRVQHWIVTLEADIDMLKVFQTAEQRQLAAATVGAAAAMALESPTLSPHEDHDEDDAGEAPLEGDVMPPLEKDPRVEIAATRRQVAQQLEELGIVLEVFDKWMARETKNPIWGKDPAGLAEALRRLQECRDADDSKLWILQRSLDAPF